MKQGGYPQPSVREAHFFFHLAVNGSNAWVSIVTLPQLALHLRVQRAGSVIKCLHLQSRERRQDLETSATSIK